MKLEDISSALTRNFLFISKSLDSLRENMNSASQLLKSSADIKNEISIKKNDLFTILILRLFQDRSYFLFP